jgi:outer membrane receptor protein involved in Fe transport
LSDATGGAAAIDLTGPFDDAGKLAYRLVGEVSDRDGWRDFTYEREPVLRAQRQV